MSQAPSASSSTHSLASLSKFEKATTANASSTKKIIPLSEWQAKMDGIKINKQDLNKIIMNYLIVEGYRDAAEQFRSEANISSPIPLHSIEARMHIREAIQNGNVDEAMDRVNDLDPEILDSNPGLYFHLLQQKLIELIRTGKTKEALEYAQEELAPYGEQNPQFLDELERTLTLLAFDIESSPVASLLDVGQRHRTAAEVNAAILAAQGQIQEPKLPQLLKLLMWTQTQLQEKVEFPIMKNMASAELEMTYSNTD